jgi:anti-sigma regulatory factor (Ser/Thr protein kinase)
VRAGADLAASSAANRLRRLRLLLTLFLTAVSAVGLLVFAVLAVADDARQVPVQLDGELSRVTSTVDRLLQYDNTLITAFVRTDEIDHECPQFAVLPSGTGRFPGYFSANTCVRVDPAVLAGLANSAADSGARVVGYLTGSDGKLLRVNAEPLYDNQRHHIGAIVAVTDAGPSQAAHDRFAWLVAGAYVLVIAVLAVLCHLISGRVIRPAAAALEQQEVLIAEIAHDLRTPVAALRALAETVLAHPDQTGELLPRTVKLSVRMGTIIDDVLVRARLAAGVARLNPQWVWLDQLVAGLVAETPADDAKLTVSTEPSLVRADPALVQRAVGNLVDNALRYGRQPDRPAIVHVTVADGRITVADRGPGIAEDTRLLDRFHTGRGSTGLGLSIVHWVAQAHGGTLNVYNAAEGGAIFELLLPVTTRSGLVPNPRS